MPFQLDVDVAGFVAVRFNWHCLVENAWFLGWETFFQICVTSVFLWLLSIVLQVIVDLVLMLTETCGLLWWVLSQLPSLVARRTIIQIPLVNWLLLDDYLVAGCAVILISLINRLLFKLQVVLLRQRTLTFDWASSDRAGVLLLDLWELVVFVETQSFAALGLIAKGFVVVASEGNF